jgi:hypothetical protein
MASMMIDAANYMDDFLDQVWSGREACTVKDVGYCTYEELIVDGGDLDFASNILDVLETVVEVRYDPLCFAYDGVVYGGKHTDMGENVFHSICDMRKVGVPLNYDALFSAFGWYGEIKSKYKKHDLLDACYATVYPQIFFTHSVISTSKEVYDRLEEVFSKVLRFENGDCDIPSNSIEIMDVDAYLFLRSCRIDRAQLRDGGARSKKFMIKSRACNSTVYKFFDDTPDDVVHFGSGDSSRLSRFAFPNANVECVDPVCDGTDGKSMTIEQYLNLGSDLSDKVLVSDAAIHDDLGLHSDTNIINAPLLNYGKRCILKYCLCLPSQIPSVFHEYRYKVRKKIRLHNTELILERCENGRKIGEINHLGWQLVTEANRLRTLIDSYGFGMIPYRYPLEVNFDILKFYGTLRLEPVSSGVMRIFHGKSVMDSIRFKTLGELAAISASPPEMHWYFTGEVRSGLRYYSGVAKWLLRNGYTVDDRLCDVNYQN